MKPAVQRLRHPLTGALALALAGALGHGSASAGDAPVSAADLAQYLQLHDEATRIGTRPVESAPCAAAGECVRQAEQPGAARKEVRG